MTFFSNIDETVAIIFKLVFDIHTENSISNQGKLKQMWIVITLVLNQLENGNVN